MTVKTVKFPQTPEETLDKVKELKYFIDAFYNEIGERRYEVVPAEFYVQMWHSRVLDFIEILNENNERIGLLASRIVENDFNGSKGASVMVAYISPEYRGKGYFKEALRYAKVVYQAKHYDSFSITVPKDIDLKEMGELKSLVYEVRL